MRINSLDVKQHSNNGQNLLKLSRHCHFTPALSDGLADSHAFVLAINSKAQSATPALSRILGASSSKSGRSGKYGGCMGMRGDC